MPTTTMSAPSSLAPSAGQQQGNRQRAPPCNRQRAAIFSRASQSRLKRRAGSRADAVHATTRARTQEGTACGALSCEQPAAHSWQGGASQLRSRLSPCVSPTAAARKAKARTPRRSLKAAAAARAGSVRDVTRTMHTETHAGRRTRTQAHAKAHTRTRAHAHTHSIHRTRRPGSLSACGLTSVPGHVRACERASSASACVCACVQRCACMVCVRVFARTCLDGL